MIKLIRSILGLCNHRWEYRGMSRVYHHPDDGPQDMPKSNKVILQCKTCGKMTTQKL